MSGVRTHTISRTGFLSDPRPPARHRVAAVFSIEKSSQGRIALRKREIISFFRPVAAKESHKAGFFLNYSAKTGPLRVLAVFSSIGVNFILTRRRLSYEHRELRTRRTKQNNGTDHRYPGTMKRPLIQNRKLFPRVSTTTAPLKHMCARPIRLFCSSSNGSGIRSLR